MAGKLNKGYIQVYTGDGKGKTTAALGLALRAVGRGLTVIMIQFMKGGDYGEHLAARRLEPELTIIRVGKPYFIAKEEEIDPDSLEDMREQVQVFPAGHPPEEYRRLACQGLELARDAVTSGRYDLVILDEINVAVYFELVSAAALLEVLRQKRPDVEVVLTGRYAAPEVVALADLVTEMKDVKHYFHEGVAARTGVEH